MSPNLSLLKFVRRHPKAILPKKMVNVGLSATIAKEDKFVPTISVHSKTKILSELIKNFGASMKKTAGLTSTEALKMKSTTSVRSPRRLSTKRSRGIEELLPRHHISFC